MDSGGVEEVLAALGELLAEADQEWRFLVIGGASLLLQRFIDRPTADVDVAGVAAADGYRPLARLPEPVTAAAREVGEAFGLRPDWINVGPAGLVELDLPPGLPDRVHKRVYGGLEIHLPDRVDLICFKLYAAVDQAGTGKHFSDLQAMAPTPDDLIAAADWTRTHDPSPGFLAELVRVLGLFGVDYHGRSGDGR